MAELSVTEHAKAAATAHNDLNALHSVIALLESGIASADIYNATNRIIRICHQESQRCLVRYDKHMVAIKKAEPHD